MKDVAVGDVRTFVLMGHSASGKHFRSQARRCRWIDRHHSRTAASVPPVGGVPFTPERLLVAWISRDPLKAPGAIIFAVNPSVLIGLTTDRELSYPATAAFRVNRTVAGNVQRGTRQGSRRPAVRIARA